DRQRHAARGGPGGGRQQRHARPGPPGEYRRGRRADRSGRGAGGGVARGKRRGLRGYARGALRGLDAVPCAQGDEGRDRFTDVGPLRDLPAHRRYVYPDNPRQLARRLGLDALRTRMGSGGGRHCLQGPGDRSFRHPLDRCLRADGLAVHNRREAHNRPPLAGGPRPARRGRRPLHRRYRLLPLQANTLLPRRLAPLRRRRERLPLPRHRLLRARPRRV
ncbi:MAG: FIG01964566: Predicted membrane protein, hemolysin III homolog, partial [uncultured Rubrobacteraceae bacterium]